MCQMRNIKHYWKSLRNSSKKLKVYKDKANTNE